VDAATQSEPTAIKQEPSIVAEEPVAQAQARDLPDDRVVINNRAKPPPSATGKKKVIVQESPEDHECCGEVTRDSCYCSLADCCGPKHPGH